MTSLILVAPIGGWSSPLEEVPDAVFAGKIMGDGVAVDPTEATLHAPCDGEVVTIATAKHAVVLRASNGSEILLHVGCNTVALGGEGFDVHVASGQQVRTGDPLLTFDLDGIAQRVLSLVTPIILMNGKGFEIGRREEQRLVRAGDFLMELQPLGVAAGPDGAAGGPEIRSLFRVPFEHGIHARPAALLSSALRGFSAEVRALAHGRTANARSAVAWMELGVRRGDEITVIATGPDARGALAALETLLSTPGKAARPSPDLRRAPADNSGSSASPRDAVGVVRGVIASRGIAVGPAASITGPPPTPTENGRGVAHETAELERARGIVRAQLERLRGTASGLARDVLDAHLSFLDDPDLLDAAHDAIARGRSAGHAWQGAIEESVAALRAVGDPRVAERADDLRDLAGRVLRALAGETIVREPPAGSILTGQEILPSQLVALGAGRIAGFCTAAGGPTSHVALLAAAMNLPALVAAGPDVLRIADGTPLVLDAEEGLLRVAPDATTLAATEQTVIRRREQHLAAQGTAVGECRLASGERIEVFANVTAASEVAGAIEQGAEGCGLLRTEFLFLDRDTPPDVAQQCAEYQSIVAAFDGRPVVIRTLDAGSDKPLRYLPLPHSENPALGVRGIRASLWRPELLRDQLRAILRVEPRSACRIMLPMVTDRSEVESVRRILEELCQEIGCSTPPLGVMIETPAAALLAESLATVADFLSIGTNDLAQYTLAMDRGQAELAGQLDALHPAVLQLIRATAAGGRAAGRSVGVCGGLASDPTAAPLLVGLGVDELSAVPSVIPEIKATLRAVRLDDCRALAERALAANSASAVRAVARVAGANR
jgi:phosphocarrier protein FPr/phosphocarrier protein